VTTSVCKSCQAPIIWCRTATGKKMPVDAAPSQEGNLSLVDGDGPLPTAIPVSRSGDRTPGTPLYTSHFANCKTAVQHRRNQPKTTPPPVTTGRDLFADGGAQ